MDEMEKKFSNFKVFLLEIEGISSLFQQAINMCSLEQFLMRLKVHKDKTLDDFIVDIAKSASIDLTSISFEKQDRFRRYLTYFRKVAAI